jgi:hypothetical protein
MVSTGAGVFFIGAQENAQNDPRRMDTVNNTDNMFFYRRDERPPRPS